MKRVQFYRAGILLVILSLCRVQFVYSEGKHRIYINFVLSFLYYTHYIGYIFFFITIFHISAQFFDFFSKDRTFNSILGGGGGGGGGGYGAPQQQSGYGVPKAPVVNRPSYNGGQVNRPRPSYGKGCNNFLYDLEILLMI